MVTPSWDRSSEDLKVAMSRPLGNKPEVAGAWVEGMWEVAEKEKGIVTSTRSHHFQN